MGHLWSKHTMFGGWWPNNNLGNWGDNNATYRGYICIWPHLKPVFWGPLWRDAGGDIYLMFTFPPNSWNWRRWKSFNVSTQIIETSRPHPKWQGSRGTPSQMALFQENSGWWNIMICPDCIVALDLIKDRENYFKLHPWPHWYSLQLVVSKYVF